jgi:hypothetical protein
MHWVNFIEGQTGNNTLQGLAGNDFLDGELAMTWSRRPWR